MIGKEVRLGKILDPVTKRTCLLPLDHGVTSGPIQGLGNIVQTIQEIGVEKTDGIIVHKGVFSQLTAYPELLRKGQFLLHLSASTTLGESSAYKCIISSVEQAVKLGAIGVSVHVNLGNRYERQMLKNLGNIGDRCNEWGMPLLAMMYIRNDNDENSSDARQIAHGARVAQELGADIIKITCPRDIAALKGIVESVQIPVIISGGEKIEDIVFLKWIGEALETGIAGISAGRNVFQSQNPKKLLTLLSDLVHKRITYNDIERIYSEERYYLRSIL